MNKTIIIGNLTRDPEYNEVGNDRIPCCNFTVAVNRRMKNTDHPQADYFCVTAWRQLADLCASYLAKGRKVCVEGRIGARAYIGNDGSPRASMELTADSVEFLTPRDRQGAAPEPSQGDADGFTPIDDADDLPF